MLPQSSCDQPPCTAVTQKTTNVYPQPQQPTCTQLQPAVPDSHSRLPFYPHPPPAMTTRRTTQEQLEGSPAYSELPSTPQKTFPSPSQEEEPPRPADSPSKSTETLA